MSTIHAPDFYEPRKKWRSKKRDEFLRENVGIDPAVLADGLGVPERFVISYQRKLGVRPLTGNPLGGERGAMLLLSKPTRCAECDAPAKIQAYAEAQHVGQ
jgi:hypothetical protein